MTDLVKKLTCETCGKKWKTTTPLNSATCPRCDSNRLEKIRVIEPKEIRNATTV